MVDVGHDRSDPLSGVFAWCDRLCGRAVVQERIRRGGLVRFPFVRLFEDGLGLRLRVGAAHSSLLGEQVGRAALGTLVSYRAACRTIVAGAAVQASAVVRGEAGAVVGREAGALVCHERSIPTGRQARTL